MLGSGGLTVVVAGHGRHIRAVVRIRRGVLGLRCGGDIRSVQ